MDPRRALAYSKLGTIRATVGFGGDMARCEGIPLSNGSDGSDFAFLGVGGGGSELSDSVKGGKWGAGEGFVKVHRKTTGLRNDENLCRGLGWWRFVGVACGGVDLVRLEEVVVCGGGELVRFVGAVCGGGVLMPYRLLNLDFDNINFMEFDLAKQQLFMKTGFDGGKIMENMRRMCVVMLSWTDWWKWRMCVVMLSWTDWWKWRKRLVDELIWNYSFLVGSIGVSSMVVPLELSICKASRMVITSTRLGE